MADDKEIIKKLLKIATNQQKIITKLAQGAPPTAMPTPDSPTKRSADAILGALPPPVRQAVSVLEVHPSRDPNFSEEVKVRFVPGKGSSQIFSALQKIVQKLQSSNVLPGQSYKITEVS